MIQIEPLDTLFFRDGKPFSMGDESTAFGIFPPLPSTVFGAVRTAVISQNSGFKAFVHSAMAKEIGTPYDYSDASFHIKGIFLYKVDDECLYLPAPLDLITENKKEENIAVKRLTPVKTSMFVTDNSGAGYEYCLFSVQSDKAEGVGEYYLSQSDLQAYLTGDKEEFNPYPEKLFCEIEFKTGIKISSKTGTCEEGHLYRVGMRRFKKDVALVCDADGIPSLKPAGVLKLGGEGKTVCYQPISLNFKDIRQSVIDRITKTRQLKLYFATPAMFENGWMIDDNFLNCKEYRLNFMTAAVGNGFPVGGWNMMGGKEKKGAPKQMMRAVPAGSVYYFSIEHGDPAVIYDRLNYQNLSLRSQEGFGLTFVGGV